MANLPVKTTFVVGSICLPEGKVFREAQYYSFLPQVVLSIKRSMFPRGGTVQNIPGELPPGGILCMMCPCGVADGSI